MASKRPRLVDVATHADVAPSTVSRALAGSPSISEATRARVVAAAEELGYEANPAAAGLKRGNTLNIGLVALTNYWYAGVVTTGADRLAAESGYDFVVMNSAGGVDTDLMFARARRLGRRVDGALIVDIEEGNVLDELIRQLDVPVVTLGCAADGVSSVLVDNERIGRTAADHLAGFGHDRAAVLTLENLSPSAYDNAAVREHGFVDAFPGAVRRFHVPFVDRGRRTAEILAATAEATAVFCTSDELAIETVVTLRESGRSVPETISVVGVDDHPLAQPVGLTTIAQAPERMGELATEILLGHLTGDAAPRHELADTWLVARRTSGPVGS